ncbi:MAG: ATP synthase archaeal subunit H [Archaeoglobaceae archaeon]|nr:ATP synthase archaeal subunit H [Archaeoglobaceae archaeon]MDW8118282.1 ATP synthase archaeal subunit H [Archaeoglobaceae archaeon]
MDGFEALHKVVSMEKTEILMRIKEAEARVEDTIKKAEEQRKRSVFDAKIGAKKILDDANNEASRLRGEILRKIREAVEKEKEDIRTKKLKEINDFEKKGRKNVDKAVEVLYNDFIGMVEHA